jgi:hypothetical protein
MSPLTLTHPASGRNLWKEAGSADGGLLASRLVMPFGKRGWLKTLVAEAVKAHPVAAASSSRAQAATLPTGRARARRYLMGIVRESGLSYGTPAAEGAPGAAPGTSREEVLFLAVLRTFCTVALDIAVLCDAAPGPRPEQLLLLLAALSGRLDEAEDIHLRIERATRQWPLPEKVWAKVEDALERRALSLAADPYYGLVLHNGAVYSDALLFGRLAIAYFTNHRFPKEAAERRLRFAALQKALLVEVLVGLVCAERPPSFPTRRAILRQIDDLGLPEDLALATTAFAREAFERPPSMRRVLGALRSRHLKRFILEQTLLASLVDGRRSPREVAWTESLGAQLGFSLEEVRATELAMAEFYAQHRGVVDVFTLRAGAEVMGEELVDSMATSVQKNYRRLLKEVKQTGELSKLLARAARGQALSADEKQRLRAQLVDLAKAVPTLAIFAAPGGLLLLMALAKVLPFDLLPSAFRDEAPPAEVPRPATTLRRKPRTRSRG